MKRLFSLTVFCFFLNFVLSFGADFRVDNELLVEGATPKIASTMFVMNDDFISLIGENGEITFFNADRQVFTLLDPMLRIQTQIDAAETKKKIELIRQHRPEIAANTFNAFAVKPSFQMEFEEASGILVLQSPWIDYTLTTNVLTNHETAKQYFDVCDWLCYLNFRIDPHSTAMLIRLEVNRILRKTNRFASHISVTAFPKGKTPIAKSEKKQSTHKIVLRLDSADQKKIDQAKEFQRTFTMIPLSDYQKKAAEKNEKKK
jgi:hypothetical protein